MKHSKLAIAALVVSCIGVTISIIKFIMFLMTMKSKETDKILEPDFPYKPQRLQSVLLAHFRPEIDLPRNAVGMKTGFPQDFFEILESVILQII